MSQDRSMPLAGRIIILVVIVLCAYAGYYFLVKRTPSTNNPADPGSTTTGTTTATSNAWSGSTVTLGIAYGTEKKTWFEWAAQEFAKTADGQKIKLNLIPKGSQEGAQALVAGDKSIQVWSPASALYKETFVQDWQIKYNNNPIIKEDSLALSPMVFVMWDERYKAFIEKKKKVDFTTVVEALQEKGGWDSLANKPEWGLFKFGHTNPNKSNSGLVTLTLMAYNFNNKTRDLALKDILNPNYQEWLTNLERGVSGLSDSTGTLMKEMVLKGPSSYDAVFVYENVAIDQLKNAQGRWGELHIVYPRENMWSDNPYYIIDAPWSSKDQRAAADVFLKFLLSDPIQQEALKHGFRPANPAIPIKGGDSPFELYQKYGLQIEPGSTCEAPKAEVITNLMGIWQRSNTR